MAETSLYLVSVCDFGDDLSLIVEASNPEQAAQIYAARYEVTSPADLDETFKVFEVPALTGTPQVRDFFEDVKDVTP